LALSYASFVQSEALQHFVDVHALTLRPPCSGTVMVRSPAFLNET
jgi:hypothetical protein